LKFKTKKELPYPLLCDPGHKLIKPLGLEKAAGKTQRGVFAVDKSGKILLLKPGSPASTVNAVKALEAKAS
jgi:peroxiredoxin Q/BCP